MDVSFIIPVYNQLEHTQQCLRTLHETLPPGLDHEILIADDGSAEPTRSYLSRLPSRYTVLYNERNLGYAASNNRAAKVARGEFLFLLNNDLVLQSDWLPPMLEAFRYCRNLGIVGNRQLDARTGELDHAGMVFHCGGYPIHYRDPSGINAQADYQRFPAVTAACCAIRRDVFLRFGGFSTDYRNGFEDVDLCLRLHMAGFRNLIAQKSIVRHYISSSPGRQAHEQINARHFLGKWQSVTADLEREWHERVRFEAELASIAVAKDTGQTPIASLNGMRQKLLSGNFCLYRRSRLLRRLRAILPKAPSAPGHERNV